MQSNFRKDDLIAFEDLVADLFNAGEIRAPIHLSNGGENELIEIFRKIGPDDYVFSSWRSHYHALLKGVDPTELLSEIRRGNSICLNFPEYKLFSSAIAGSQLPLAVGAAAALKRSQSKNHVWCFVGDMTAESGIASSSIKYASRHQLPVTFVVEDNNRSVCSDTRLTWGSKELSFADKSHDNVIYYYYKSKYPHAGAGVRVQF